MRPMDHRKWLGGQRKDLIAIGLRTILGLAETPYRMGVWYRNRGYDSGKSVTHRCDVPVVSIGNLTTGGTGKTPLVCFIAKHLRSMHKRVAIVSRGYGAEAGEENDEAMELARLLPDVPHVQDADRVEAARIALEELECEVILMDDGFQHRRLHRDVDIVVIDATNPFGYNHLLPRGLLREPIKSLSRAHAIVLSRANAVDESTRQQIWQQVKRHAPKAIYSEANHAPRSLLDWREKENPIDFIRGKRVLALSAIGNPDAFASTIRQCGAEIVGVKVLPDHDRYSSETVDSITQWLRSFDDRSLELVCTHKDLVKLQTDQLAGHHISALIVQMQFQTGEKELLDLVSDTICAS